VLDEESAAFYGAFSDASLSFILAEDSLLLFYLLTLACFD
jgi:hypothetical protein